MTSSRTRRLQGLLSRDVQALPHTPPEPEPEPGPALAISSSDEDDHPNGGVSVTKSPEVEHKPISSAPITSSLKAPAIDDRELSPPLSDLSGEPSEHHFEQSQTHRRHAANLLRGDRAPFGEAYCSIQVVSKFPYKFLGKSYSDPVAKKLFDRNKFWSRDWDLFYIWPPADIAGKPLILITRTQLQELIDDINKYKRNIDFRLSDYHHNIGLIIDIPHPDLAPRYLGLSSSREEYNDMERRVPAMSYKAPGEPTMPPADKPTLEAFKEKIEEAILLNKAKNKAAKAKKKEQRIQLQQNWGHQLKRIQRYLGLRPDQNDSYNPLHDPTLNWAQLQAAEAARKLQPIDPDKVAPFAFDKKVVFVSVDIEAFELDTNKITEIGIATLDVLDIINTPPGKDGKDWFDKIRARHFRIQEHAHLENFRHVAGCASGFEFGKSEFVRLAEAPSIVASCFKPPFSASLTVQEAERLLATEGTPPTVEGAPDTPILNADSKRHIIFVGHDPNQDIKFLQKLGYNPLNLSSLIETVDTKLLHQHWKRDTQGTSLGKVLADLDIVGWRLHNGGNDAVYTMQAMLALCVREASSRGTKELAEQRKEAQQRRMSDAIAEAVAKVSDDADGWSSADEGNDGSAPIKPATGARPRATAPFNGNNEPKFPHNRFDTKNGLGTNDYIPPPGHVNPEISSTLFVGNLAFSATRDDVALFFSDHGKVIDVHLPMNPTNGAGKGVGYVSFSSETEAKAAMDKCKGTEMFGRSIRLDWAPCRSHMNRSGRTTPAAQFQSQRSSRSNTPAPTGYPQQYQPNFSQLLQPPSSVPFHPHPQAQSQHSNNGYGSGSDTGGVNVAPPSAKLDPSQLPDDWWN